MYLQGLIQDIGYGGGIGSYQHAIRPSESWNINMENSSLYASIQCSCSSIEPRVSKATYSSASHTHRSHKHNPPNAPRAHSLRSFTSNPTSQ